MILTAFLKNSNETNQNKTTFEPYQYGTTIRKYQQEDIDLEQIDIVILGWGNSDYSSIQEQLYLLTSNFKAQKVLDLGELKPTISTLIALLKVLFQNGVFPLIISPKAEAVEAQLKAYEKEYELLNMTLVDSRLPYAENQPNRLINKLLDWYPHLLFYLNCLGHQSYLVDGETVHYLEDKYFDTYRLGAIQEQIKEVEPLVRNADLVAFSVEAIRCADAPARTFMNPNGLMAVEACKIMRYIAMGDQLTSLCIHGFDLVLDDRKQSANMIAQLIWFAVGGFYARMNEYPVELKKMATYLVDNTAMKEPITFYKSPKSNRWWIAIPKAISPKHELVPCSYEDYQSTCEGDLPDRLWNAITRLQL